MNFLVTDEAKLIASYLEKTWPTAEVLLEQRLSSFLPKPTNTGLLHIWKYGSADIVVKRRNKVVAVLEPGGSAHFQDERQMKNDRRKWKLCNINGVACLKIANGVFVKLTNRQKRQLIGKLLFPKQASDAAKGNA